MPPEPQDQHAKRFHEKTPDDAERIGLSKQYDITPADNDRDELEANDGIDEPIRGPESFVRPPEPRHQHSVLSQAIQNPVSAYDGGVHRSRQDQNADDDDEDVETKSNKLRTGEMHRQAA